MHNCGVLSMKTQYLFVFIIGFLTKTFLDTFYLGGWLHSSKHQDSMKPYQQLLQKPFPEESENNIDTFLINEFHSKYSIPKKVFSFMKKMGCGISNMGKPSIWEDVDGIRGKLVVDVGAFDGSDWSIPAVLNRDHTVVAFEPLNTNSLRDNIRTSGISFSDIKVSQNLKVDLYANESRHIYIIQSALSNYSGWVEMYSNGPLASLTPQNFYDGAVNEVSLKIPCLRLDDVISQAVYLLKIDTQGNELVVLEGAKRLLENNMITLIELEFWPKGIRQGGYDPHSILDLLHFYGFMCFDWSKNHHLKAEHSQNFKQFIQTFDEWTQDSFGAWDELICFNTLLET